MSVGSAPHTQMLRKREVDGALWHRDDGMSQKGAFPTFVSLICRDQDTQRPKRRGGCWPEGLFSFVGA